MGSTDRQDSRSGRTQCARRASAMGEFHWNERHDHPWSWLDLQAEQDCVACKARVYPCLQIKLSPLSSILVLFAANPCDQSRATNKCMLYGTLADIVVVLHFAFILFVVFGALLSLRWSWVPFIQLPTVIWGAYIEFQSVVCPLTPLEIHLRKLAGEDGYRGGFIENYLLPVIYPAGLDSGHQLVLGALAILINVALYGYVVFRKRRQGDDIT